ncbi:hypothetical protein [Niveispirillum sp. BGYR6]|uniref:hypothetical protein n=1 Tax=Niveispirillum sp. BGYR6 TaxID=2971249 RepID=UPI0022B96D26|nr:hypothetical protein [Niveispirillum sp. BGYR6]MDG5497921.1 hypothetical protein [Niveispirillum sp. BGYR6]
MQPIAEFWPRAVEIYQGSGSFRGSEANFRDLVMPFVGHLSSSQYDQLLDAIIANGQNLSAAETGNLLLNILRNTAASNRPTHDARNRFYNRLRRVYSRENYAEVFDLFQEDGWKTPPTQGDDE